MVMINHQKISTTRAKKYRVNKIKEGFKRVQKWVFDIENVNIQLEMKNDLLNYVQTEEAQEWNDFSLNQANSIDGWK